MVTIFLALGSNVGDKINNITQAIKLLKEKIHDIKMAPLYETKPAYYEDQDIFVNTILKGATALTPEELLVFTQEVEKKVGRIFRFRYGPREVDVDIIFYDDLVYQNDKLQTPHPLMQERDFVLRPLCDLNLHLLHPRLHKTVSELLEELPKEKLTIARKIELE